VFHDVLISFLEDVHAHWAEGGKGRGKIMVKLAKANRFATANHLKNTQLSDRIGLQSGFISVYCTKERAQKAMKEADEFGEEAELLSRKQALELEPKLADLPLREEFDQVILAAGIFTPVFATHISWRVGQSCPVYPLKGYSLTVFAKPKQNGSFLRKPMSFDNMYCTSVAPNMIGMAGFGEMVGFPKAGCTSCATGGGDGAGEVRDAHLWHRCGLRYKQCYSSMFSAHEP